MTGSIDAATVAAVLGGTKSGTGYKCRCPAHEDAKPSLLVRDKPDGGLSIKCLAGCEYVAVRDALVAKGLWPSGNKRLTIEAKVQKQRNWEDFKIFPKVPSDAPAPNWDALNFNPTAVYDYVDAEGQLLFKILRRDTLLDGKEIRPICFGVDRNGERGWRSIGYPEPRPLYGLDRLQGRDRKVLLVEGEKTADAARDIFPELVVVTWPGGAAAHERFDIAPLADRDVILWPDNDVAGKKAMDAIGMRLAAIAKSVNVVSLPSELPEKWDLADAIPDSVDVRALVAGATPVGLRKFILTAPEFCSLRVPPVSFLIEPWLTRGSLSMIWAQRGIGKTWFSISMALALVKGEDFLYYSVERPAVVLYIDGEMPTALLQSRLRQLGGHACANLHIMPSELLFKKDHPLNINSPDDQRRIKAAIAALEAEGIKPDVIIFDNLSSLMSGVDENNNSELDGFLKFLITLRHDDIAVVIVHHAGKTNEQRGASRREDILDTSIKLEKPEKNTAHSGAHFMVEFTKTRGEAPDPKTFELKLIEDDQGKKTWAKTQPSKISRSDMILRELALNGALSQSELVRRLAVTKGQISKDCKPLKEQGLVQGNPLELTAKGRQYVVEVFTDLYSKLARQDNFPV